MKSVALWAGLYIGTGCVVVFASAMGAPTTGAAFVIMHVFAGINLVALGVLRR